MYIIEKKAIRWEEPSVKPRISLRNSRLSSAHSCDEKILGNLYRDGDKGCTTRKQNFSIPRQLKTKSTTARDVFMISIRALLSVFNSYSLRSRCYHPGKEETLLSSLIFHCRTNKSSGDRINGMTHFYLVSRVL